MRRPGLAVLPTLALTAVFAPTPARAGSFDAHGDFAFDESAIVTNGFASFDDPDAGDAAPTATVVKADDALEGTSYLSVATGSDVVRWHFAFPPKKASYRARLWMRHGQINAHVNVVYPDGSGHPGGYAKLGPTGRTTSDGWVELETNEFPIDGARATDAWLLLQSDATDVDAFELVESGAFVDPAKCDGFADPACGAGEVCIDGYCREGRLYVPPIPPATFRDADVDYLESRLRYHFGARATRLAYLKSAIDQTEKMRGANDPWVFWNGWTTAVRRLHDWHTHASGAIQGIGTHRAIHACFLEGDADLTHAAFPSDATYMDVLVDYVGPDHALGMHAGDRLVAVDGMHPIAWARTLVGVDWGYWQACDDRTNAEFVERMPGLIAMYAMTFSVVHCDAATIHVADLPEDDGGIGVSCDNRPAYHLPVLLQGTDYNGNPIPETHALKWAVYRDVVADSQPGENIYGMTWDNLWGPSFAGDFKTAMDDFQANARGVILDHRAGNGGTIQDTLGPLTQMVRPIETVGVFPAFKQIAGWSGPNDATEGLAFFAQYEKTAPLVAGGATPDTSIPVALLLHRDGSASDFFPFGIQGSPHVRLFGVHRTAGAFSSFIDFGYWGALGWQIASGDMIDENGVAHLGTGVLPEQIVVEKQSDLLVGKDAVYEAALAWVRSELKP
jgi:hypothetical protein